MSIGQIRSKVAVDQILGKGGKGVIAIQQPTNSTPSIRAVVFLDNRRIVIINSSSRTVATFT